MIDFAGNYSCLVAQFHMRRSVSFHLIQSYLPSILIVAVSWVSFWMDIESVPGRISLGVITLLAVSSQAGLGTFKELYNMREGVEKGPGGGGTKFSVLLLLLHLCLLRIQLFCTTTTR